MSSREVIVVVQKGDHSLGYYDFETGAELDRVPIDPFPHEFAISPDGRLAYMAHFGVALAEDEGPGGNTVSVVDIQARRRVGTIHCGEYRRPHDVTFDANGALYVLSEGSSNLLVVQDPRSGRIDHVVPTGGEGSHKVSVSRDGSLAFCSKWTRWPGNSCASSRPAAIPIRWWSFLSRLEEARGGSAVAARPWHASSRGKGRCAVGTAGRHGQSRRSGDHRPHTVRQTVGSGVNSTTRPSPQPYFSRERAWMASVNSDSAAASSTRARPVNVPPATRHRTP
ncbi:MAG: hypothetical protein HY803_12615 [candidate division NC10 bacterium]|nr:hypothetical protein [candidate division NC10 bacterium]